MSRAFPQVEMEPIYGFFHYLSHVVYSMWFRGEVIGLENLPDRGESRQSARPALRGLAVA